MLDAAVIDAVREGLEADAEVREEFPDGRVHIDRRLPFLLLHRRPTGPDAGTADLALGEASYVLAPGDADCAPVVETLVETIVATQEEAFGAFLLLELWTADSDAGSDELSFTLVAPTHGSPPTLLETLEAALLSITIGDQAVGVQVEYRDDWAPPGLTRLAVSDRDGLCHLGIGVPPVYRDPESGAVLPFALRELRHQFGRALKRGFYTFAHDCTPERPAHFHELGRQAMTPDVFDVDEQIASISLAFDLLLHVTPVNAREAEQEFRDGGLDQAPEFLYRARTIDPDAVKRELYGIPIERIEDPTIAHIFLEKRQELDRQLTLITDRNTPRFLLGSRAVYGDPDVELVALAERVLTECEPVPGADELLTVEEVADRARAELARYRSDDPSLESDVVIRDDIPGVMVSRGNLLIGRGSKVTSGRVEGLLAHELGIHVLTHHNGRQQPFRELYAGMAGYEALQEGLAVLWEYLVGGLDVNRLRLLAGRVLAGDAVCRGADFVETFRLLHEERGFSIGSAFNVAMRLHRGGGFVKDVVYLRGLVNVLDYLAGGGPFDRLHVGKVAFEHLSVIEELQWRQVVRDPRLMPHHLERADVQERLERCRQDVTVLDLVGAT